MNDKSILSYWPKEVIVEGIVIDANGVENWTASYILNISLPITVNPVVNRIKLRAEVRKNAPCPINKYIKESIRIY